MDAILNLLEILTSSADLSSVLPEKLSLWDGRIFVKKGYGEKSKDWTKYPRKNLDNWPPNPGTYEIRDTSGPVAFVCPSQSQELQAKAINWGAAIAGPCVTPDRGVELVVSNIIANPNIRYLVLGGNDSGHLSGDVLYCLWRYGVDPITHRVLKTNCPTNPYVRNLSKESIKRFRKQITVINVLKCANEDVIHLAIRACLQESEFPLIWEDRKLNLKLKLFDQGSENKEPFIYKLGFGIDKKTFFEGVHRIGTAIHAPTIASAWQLLRSHILKMGEMGVQESTRIVKDVIGVQVIIHDPTKKMVPENWKPHGWTKTKEQVKEWQEAYAVWVYLFPFSDVRYNQDENRIEPYIPEKMDYSYGTRLTAWGIELASAEEKELVRQLVEKAHQEFINLKRLPDFKEIIGFHKQLQKIQKISIDSLIRLAKAIKVCVDNNITASYRNYVVLQDPRIDLKPDLRLAHNPCFCLYEAYPRKINNKWQLDASFFLRANDFIAFPANAAAGIKIQEFLAWYSNINTGVYLHHTGCAHIQDYLL
ncbi:MAG: hypothetical protein ISS87_01015 [Candidatus Pacebacteria bacterium]|nr:hypothetical protein [Candidatus Paceibacterota bacterium]